MRNHLIDKYTNSTSEGFRLEGMDNAPAVLNEYKKTFFGTLDMFLDPFARNVY